MILDLTSSFSRPDSYVSLGLIWTDIIYQSEREMWLLEEGSKTFVLNLVLAIINRQLQKARHRHYVPIRDLDRWCLWCNTQRFTYWEKKYNIIFGLALLNACLNTYRLEMRTMLWWNGGDRMCIYIYTWIMNAIRITADTIGSLFATLLVTW